MSEYQMGILTGAFLCLLVQSVLALLAVIFAPTQEAKP